MKQGDLVRVKPYSEIVKTGDYYSTIGGVQSTTNEHYYFLDEMKKMCGKEYVIADKSIEKKTYTLCDNNGRHKEYRFVKEWLEKVK